MDVKPPPSAPLDIQKDVQKESINTWRPFLIGNRMRTTSEDSAESFDAYDTAEYVKTVKMEERRPSITEQFFGTSMPGRLRSNSTTEYEGQEHETKFKKVDLKQFMKHQRKILGDDEWQ